MLSASLLLASLVVSAAAEAWPGSPDWPLVPGLMGYNALPVLPNVDPVIGTRAEVEVTAAAQVSDLALRDHAVTPYLRLTVPFRETAALEVDGTPIEIWRTTAATQLRLGARNRADGTPGDARFGARFLLLRERAGPALGLRLSVKSASGKGLASRRFTNAPGYAIDLLAGKDVGTLGEARLRALARVGFVSWQFGQNEQDDAFAYGATVRATAPSGAAVELDWRGYAGWRFADRPSVIGLGAIVPVPGGELKAAFNAGASADAPPLELRVGYVWRFEVPALLRARSAPGPSTP
ncbi:hypothetical protein [Anaeromyxobacter terrae]|uniref:hypothetical protein n=1 Tax=Anaeromyxobacter terrae TaxID=2925406 RepID=UPI001F56200A|nr:hypothetical protein [Anaeromyxobacter sp. SG22]